MTIVIPTGLGTLVDADEEFFGGSGQVFRRVDVYNADGSPWYLDCPITEGSVSVDMNRDERRTLEVTFDNDGNVFRSDVTGFWYDKIIKVYRGVQNSSGEARYFPLGAFMIDTIAESNFPHVVRVAGRDYTKRMMHSKFATPTGFDDGITLESVIHSIASVAGIANRNLPITGILLTREFYFEAGKSRWEACKELATAYGYELYFDQFGTLVMRLFVDPTTAPVSFAFQTGVEGNLVTYELATNDGRVFNHVIVTGAATNTIPVSAEAENTEVTSPTRIARLGRRSYPYDSKFITTTAQALALARSMLKIMALESYELTLEALVAPWLEAGEAVEFHDPDPAPYAPTRFLLSDFTIPLTIGTMSGSARRVTIVLL